MIDRLPVSVGFELEFELEGQSIESLNRHISMSGVPTSFATRWRHTPADVSDSGVWDIKTDSSCGYEAVSPVIRTMSELKSAAEVATMISRFGGRATTRCGFHVHLGLKDLPVAAYSRLFAFMTRYEGAFMLIVNPSRRMNLYCKPLSEQSKNGIKHAFGNGRFDSHNESYSDMEGSHAAGVVERSITNAWGSDKNVWLNAHTFRRIGTLELRHMEGTLDAEKIVGYVTFLMQVVSNVLCGKKVSWGSASAKDDRMLFFTMLQQAGCYGKSPTDLDLAKKARKWAMSAYKENNAKTSTSDSKPKSKQVRQRRQVAVSAAPVQAETDESTQAHRGDLRTGPTNGL